MKNNTAIPYVYHVRFEYVNGDLNCQISTIDCQCVLFQHTRTHAEMSNTIVGVYQCLRLNCTFAMSLTASTKYSQISLD